MEETLWAGGPCAEQANGGEPLFFGFSPPLDTGFYLGQWTWEKVSAGGKMFVTLFRMKGEIKKKIKVDFFLVNPNISLLLPWNAEVPELKDPGFYFTAAMPTFWCRVSVSNAIIPVTLWAQKRWTKRGPFLYQFQRVKAHEDPKQSSDAIGMWLQTLELYLLFILGQASLKQLSCYSKSKL